MSLIDEEELVVRHDVAALLREADELTAILTASAKTAKAGRVVAAPVQMANRIKIQVEASITN